MAATEQVFVYGTLRPPSANSPADDSRYFFQVEEYVKAAEPAQLTAATMYDVRGYPAAVRGSGTIQGDLLTVQAKGLALMDAIEGHPTFFKREKVQVQTGQGVRQAWIYWAPRSLVAGCCKIEGGDWLRRNREQQPTD